MKAEELFSYGAFPQAPRYDHRDFYRNMLCPETRDALKAAIRLFEPKLILEVGSWVGCSADLMAQWAPEAKIIAIDTWRGSPEFYENPEYVNLISQGYDRFTSNNWEYRHRMYALPVDSISGLRMVHLAALDPGMIFIDGNHEYEGAFGDIHISMRRFPDAALVLDDYASEGVRQAAAECCAKFDRVVQSKDNAGWIYPRGFR